MPKIRFKAPATQTEPFVYLEVIITFPRIPKIFCVQTSISSKYYVDSDNLEPIRLQGSSITSISYQRPIRNTCRILFCASMALSPTKSTTIPAVEPRSKFQNFLTRFVWTFVMIFSFALVLYAGHSGFFNVNESGYCVGWSFASFGISGDCKDWD